jgi:hypothetical protein
MIARRDFLGAAIASAVFPAIAARSDRRASARRIRMAAADLAIESPATAKPNGDEVELRDYVAMYSKGLPHNAIGEVDRDAYATMLRALRSGSPDDFDRIPCAGSVKLTNPQAALGYNLVGPDPSDVTCPPAPRFASAEQATEMKELYWQGLLRDIPFADYDSHSLVARAATDLGRTPTTLFRCDDAGSLAGPYLSQFLWKEIAWSPFPLIPMMHSASPRRDFLDHYDSWLAVQNGANPPSPPLERDRCYVRSGRDLAEYVHRDFSYQAPLTAALILQKMGVPISRDNPYRSSSGQSGFASFGGPHLLYLIATTTQAALTACWYQKWIVHRRIRPEEFGGRVANQLQGRATYPIHDSLLRSDALAATLSAQSNALLGSSYAEGAPTHPSYPAGHAVISAAGTTVLKAFFEETFVIREPLVANASGRSLRRYDGPPLTVRGELDKLAANIGMGRCWAGIHWRSDIEEGLRLGEEVAIRVLHEERLTAHEPFGGFRFHRRDGREVRA